MQLTFELGGDVILVRILGNNILFANSQTNFQQYAPIEGLRLSKQGILKEHPDLKGKEDGEIRKEAIRRFKEKVKSMKTDDEVKLYVIEELGRFGWKVKSIQREGWRTKKYGV